MIADGSGIVAWNGRNHVGSFVASGVYVVRANVPAPGVAKGEPMGGALFPRVWPPVS